MTIRQINPGSGYADPAGSKQESIRRYLCPPEFALQESGAQLTFF
jgi:hypothetical protein